MLTQNKDELYQIWVVYDYESNFQDLEIPNKGLERHNLGLPFVEEKLLSHNEYIEFISQCCKEFIEESVFDDKYLAYKRWQELLNARVGKINKILGD